MSKGNYLDKGPKRLQFGDVVSGSTNSIKDTRPKRKPRALIVGNPDYVNGKYQPKPDSYYQGGSDKSKPVNRSPAAPKPKAKESEASEIEAARKEIYQSMAESDAKELGKYDMWKKYNKPSEDTQKYRSAADAYEAKQKQKREAEKRKATNESPRARKQNQAQGSGGKDSGGNVKEPRDLRAGKSGSDAANRTFPKKTTPPKRTTPPKPEELKGRDAGPLPRKLPEQKLQVAKPSKPSKPEASAPAGKKTRAEKIVARGTKRAQKIVDRRAKRADVKSARAEARNIVRGAKGKPMKKRMAGGLGAAAALGGAAGSMMQNSDNPTMQKIGKGLSTASNVAGVVSGGVPGLLNKAAAGGGEAAPAAAKYGKMKDRRAGRRKK